MEPNKQNNNTIIALVDGFKAFINGINQTGANSTLLATYILIGFLALAAIGLVLGIGAVKLASIFGLMM